MEIPRCPSCAQIFDKVHKKPQLLVRCGHTLCAACLTHQVKNGGRVHCPEDGICYSAKDSTTFPTNSAVIDLIERKASTCRSHGKLHEFFCSTDLCEICSECAIFGEHKGHIIITLKELQQTNSAKLVGIRFQAKKALNSTDNLEGTMRSLVEEALRRARHTLTVAFKQIQAVLKEHIFTEFDRLEAKTIEKYKGAEGDEDNEEIRHAFMKIVTFADELSVANNREIRNAAEIYHETMRLSSWCSTGLERFERFQTSSKLIQQLNVSLPVDCNKIFQALPINLDPLRRLTEGKLEESQLLLQTFPDFSPCDNLLDTPPQGDTKNKIGFSVKPFPAAEDNYRGANRADLRWSSANATSVLFRSSFTTKDSQFNVGASHIFSKKVRNRTTSHQDPPIASPAVFENKVIDNPIPSNSRRRSSLIVSSFQSPTPQRHTAQQLYATRARSMRLELGSPYQSREGNHCGPNSSPRLEYSSMILDLFGSGDAKNIFKVSKKALIDGGSKSLFVRDTEIYRSLLCRLLRKVQTTQKEIKQVRFLNCTFSYNPLSLLIEYYKTASPEEVRYEFSRCALPVGCELTSSISKKLLALNIRATIN